MKAIALGILASFFFAVTFVLNKLMSDAGGSFVWSASLRYIFMIPMLLILVSLRGNLRQLLHELRHSPWRWIGWSLVGFGLFYAPICFAAAFSPAWLVAGTWQFTILAGSLLAPLFHDTFETTTGPIKVRRRIPCRSMSMSVLILIGIAIMEWSQAGRASTRELLLGTIPVIIAAFAYPLGNRKMMELSGGRLDAYQRTFGMTIASMPLWLILSFYQIAAHGWPSEGQTLQSLVVAVSSGVIATVLFFTATDMAKDNMHKLAAVEATQSGEIVFTLVGEVLVISGTRTSVAELVGVAFVIIGMILHSFASSHRSRPVGHEAV